MPFLFIDKKIFKAQHFKIVTVLTLLIKIVYNSYEILIRKLIYKTEVQHTRWNISVGLP